MYLDCDCGVSVVTVREGSQASVVNENRLIERVAGAAGILFAILFVVGAFAAGTPDSDKPAKWVDWYSDSGNRMALILNGYLWVVAGLALLVVVAAAYQRFGAGSGLSGLYATVAGGAAILFAVVLLAAGVMMANVAGNVAFGGANVPADGDLLVQMTGQGMALVLLAGGLSAAVAFAAVSLLLVREHGPRWLAILGFVATICCIFGVVFLPMVAVPIWMICAGVVLLRRASEAPARTPPTAAAA